jgi:uncharacterized membrane protein YgdD (TMEM256/DUF423 family)
MRWLVPHILMAWAALSGAMCVVLGAYGAHGIAEPPEVLKFWETGVSYQMWHALAALGACILAELTDGIATRLARVAALLFLIGSLAFAGTLYFFVLQGYIPLRGVAPAGGFAMIAGWLCLAGAAVTSQRSA